MRVLNKTNYQTRDLQRLFRAGLKAEGVDPDPYEITVRRARREVHGEAWFGSPSIKMWIPGTKETAASGELVAQVAQVFVHEIGHTLELVHGDMIPVNEIDVSWAESIQLRKKQPRKKKPRNLQLERYEHAKQMLEKHRTKLRREEALLSKWERKVRYYKRIFGKETAGRTTASQPERATSATCKGGGNRHKKMSPDR